MHTISDTCMLQAQPQSKTMTTLIPSKLTDEVLSRYKDCPDPRLKEIMISSVKHLHSFAREGKLTEVEWIKDTEFPHLGRLVLHRNAPGIHSPVRRAGSGDDRGASQSQHGRERDR